MDPEDRKDVSERNKARRQMAQASMLLVWTIVIGFLWGLTSDTIAARVERIWPVFATIFPALMGYIAFYTHIGSKENQTILNKEAA